MRTASTAGQTDRDGQKGSDSPAHASPLKPLRTLTYWKVERG
jgi:hypothetical protein